MRALGFLLLLALVPAMAQQPAPKKKPAAKQAVHKKPTPQQVRKFDQLEKKREVPKKK
ncbi:MAG TPA: hypothetical protein VE325_05810 [Burkholderiales bacterium]|nr:hypothetical protein [Burkholderiales bacterium]